MIRVLESLERAYPGPYNVKKLVEKLNVSIDGEFLKIIKYLKDTNKIIHVLVENEFMHSDYQRDVLDWKDEISIVPKGIDFLEEIYLSENKKKMNKTMVGATTILAFGAFLQVIFYIISKDFTLNQDNPFFGIYIVPILFVIFLLIIGIIFILNSILFPGAFESWKELIKRIFDKKK